MTSPIEYNNNRFHNNFTNKLNIGKGGFGTVYSASDKSDEHHYAIKKIALSAKIVKSVKFHKITAEFRILAQLNHKNVVRYNTAWFEEEKIDDKTEESYYETDETDDEEDSNSGSRIGSRHSTTSQRNLLDITNGNSELSSRQDSPTKYRVLVYIQMELCNSTLRNFLENRNYQVIMSAEDRKTICSMSCQLLTGIDYLKSKEIVHRDVKPENIFIKGSYLKIGDFGLAKFLRSDIENSESAQKMSANVGTPIYIAPEVLGKHVNYDHRCDLYSVGVILIELTMKFATISELCHTLKDISDFGRCDDLTADWPIEAPLVLNLLSPDVNQRPSASSILNDLLVFKQFVNEISESSDSSLTEERERFDEERKRFDEEKIRLVAENKKLADENEKLADKNEKLAVENEKLADENEKLADQNEKLAEENANMKIMKDGFVPSDIQQ